MISMPGLGPGRNDPCQTFQRHDKFGRFLMFLTSDLRFGRVAVMIPAQILVPLGTRVMLANCFDSAFGGVQQSDGDQTCI